MAEESASQGGPSAPRPVARAARPRRESRYPPLGLSPTVHRSWTSASNTPVLSVSRTAVAASKERSSAARMRATLPAAKMAHALRHGGHVRRRLPVLLRRVDRRRALRFGHLGDPAAARPVQGVEDP